MTKITSTDEWVDAAIEHLKKLENPEERYEFVHSMIFNLAIWGGYTDYEMIGILECVKTDLLDNLKRGFDDEEE